MTWLDNYQESQKTPAIGTPEWIECIPTHQRAEANKLLAAGTPVCVMPAAASGWKVVFDETEFVAGAFADHAAAETFASEWNRHTVSAA